MDTSLHDVAQALEYLELASRRGAFEISEFKDVGAVYSNLKRFIDSARIPSSDRKTKVKQADAPREGKQNIPPPLPLSTVPENERAALL